MAVKIHEPKTSHGRLWGGAAGAVIVLVAALGYWFGMGGVESTAPATEQAAPATE